MEPLALQILRLPALGGQSVTPAAHRGVWEGEDYELELSSFSDDPASPHDFALQWMDRRPLESINAAGGVDRVVVRTRRRAHFRVIPAERTVLVSGIRRRFTLLREMAWQKSDAGAVGEIRLALRGLVALPSFKTHFQDALSEVAVDDIPVAKVANVDLVAKVAKVGDVVDLLSGTRATVRSVVLRPWDERLETVRITARGHVEITGPSTADWQDTFDAFGRVFLASGILRGITHG